MDKEKLKLSEEVAEIFEAFVEYRQSSNELYDELEGGLNKVVYGFAVFAFILGSVLLFFAPDFIKESVVLIGTTFLLILLGFVGIMVHAFMTRESMKVFFTDATLDLLKGFPELAKSDLEFLQSLDKYSFESLRFVKLRFDNSVSSLNTLVGLLVGFLEKIGIFPALLALIVAFVKLPQSGALSLYTIAAFIVLGVYFVCFKVSVSKMFFNRYSFLLDFYLEHMREDQKS